MPPREEMLRCMQERAATVVPDGEPIIRDGPIATAQDIQEFKSLVEALGYSVKFGQSKSVTKPGNQRVELEARCSVGTLTDEFLHVWNNHSRRRGHFLGDLACAKEHQASAPHSEYLEARTTAASTSSNSEIARVIWSNRVKPFRYSFGEHSVS
jgi:hypothetical protein